MSMLINYFKQKLSIAITEELPQQYTDKMQVIEGSLELPDTLTENISDQIDVVLEEFRINIKTNSLKEIKNNCTILKSFGFVISEDSGDALIEKLELVTALSKLHGFSSISKISESDLANLQSLYLALTGAELRDINYDMFDKVRKINLSPIKEVARLDAEELNKFLDFCKLYGIDTNLKPSDLAKTSDLNEVFEILKIENSWLAESNQKKLVILFKASDIGQISDLSSNYRSSLSTIRKEFRFDFNKQSQLKLKSFIKLILSLNLTFQSRSEEIESTAEFVREFCKIEELNPFDAYKIAVMSKELNIMHRNKKEAEEVVRFLKAQGVLFSLNSDLDEEKGKVQKISEALKIIINKSLLDASYTEIEEVSDAADRFVNNKIIAANNSEITTIQKIFQLFQRTKQSFNAKHLEQVFKAFKISPSDTSKLETLSKNINKLDLDIWELDKSEIQKVQDLLVHLDVSLTDKTITEAKKEQFIKIKELLGADYQKRDIEKLKKLLIAFDKESLSDLEAEEVVKIKIIIEELGLDIKQQSMEELENIATILLSHNIKSVASQQSAISKIWSGEEQALKDKLVQIKEIFSAFGYQKLYEIVGQEEVKFRNLLNLYGKEGYRDFTPETSQNIKAFFSNLDINFKELSSYQLKQITEGLHGIGIDLFGSKEHLEQYEVFVKELKIDVEKLTKSEGSKIGEKLDLFKIDRENIKEEVKIINEAITKLHLPIFEKIKQDQINKLHEFGEAITGDAIEMTPKIALNLGNILSSLKISFEQESQAQYHNPKEKGLMSAVKKLQIFNVDLLSIEASQDVDNVITYISKLYQDKCRQQADFINILSVENDKIDDFLLHAASRKECFSEEEKCTDFITEIASTMTQLCTVIHDEL